jgi:hypothetical protein
MPRIYALVHGHAERAGVILTLLVTDVVTPGTPGTLAGEAEAGEEARRVHLAMTRQALQADGEAEVLNLGDAVLVTFRSAAAGVVAAVSIQQAAAEQSPALRVRVALHVGEAGDEAIGLSAATATTARLCAEAEPGEVLVTGVIVALAASRIEIPFTERAVSDPLLQADRVHRLEWSTGPVTRRPDVPFLSSRVGDMFVGRQPEMRRLAEVWAEVRRGGTGVVVLAGEPGIGKTALARRLAALAYDGGALVLHGGCEEDLDAPYQPFIEAIRQYAATHPAEIRRLGASGGRLAVIVPEVAAQVEVVNRGDSGDPDLARLLLFEAAVDLLGAASAEHPTVLVVDDLQWASRPTLLMLGHVCRSRLPSLLVVLCYRNTEMADAPGLWELLSDFHRLPTVRTLNLSGLNQADVVAYVEATGSGEGNNGPVALGRAVHARTEGNPLFVREVLAHLQESPLDGRELPAEVREVIDRRLSRVSSGTRQVLAAGAVAGPSFSFSVLERLPDATDDADALVASLEEAAAAGLVREAVGDRFSFSHDLVRQALYDGLSSPRRLRLHRSVAMALEALPGPPDGDRLIELAHHYSEAASLGCAEQGVRYLRSAAEQAREALALDVSITHLERALGLVPGIADGEQRRRQELDLVLSLGPIMSAAFGLGDERITAVYARAEVLAHEVGDVAERFRALQGVFSYWVGRPDHARARPIGDALVALADEVGSPAMAFSARAWRGATAYMAGQRPLAAADFAVALEIYDPARNPLDMLDPGLTAMVFSALTDWDFGHEESALDQAAAACEIAAGRHPFTVAYVNAHVAKLHARRGDAEAAALFATRAATVAEEHGLRQLAHQAGWVAGWAHALEGRLEEGANEIEAAIEGLSRSSSMADASHAMVTLVEVRHAMGDDAAALTVAAQAEEFMATTDERAHEAELHRLIGVLMARSDPVAAEEQLNKAVEVARAQGVVPYERGAEASLAAFRQGPDPAPT